MVLSKCCHSWRQLGAAAAALRRCSTSSAVFASSRREDPACSSNSNGSDVVQLADRRVLRDDFSNVSAGVAQLVGRDLHRVAGHPLCLLKQRITEYLARTYRMPGGRSPRFTLLDELSPVVSPAQNFDSLLVPRDHVSRRPRDTYYLNREWLLRSHTSAHQVELLAAGLDAFLVAGDVYRRDTIDRTHYPVFHQMEGVRLFTEQQLFRRARDPAASLQLLELDGGSERDAVKQELHTLESVKLLEFELKDTLMGLARAVWGEHVETRWVDAYFPFTHPSWELEVRMPGGAGTEPDDGWVEMLGCGIIEQGLLQRAGASHKVGWAFGLGLERWAMRLYDIPDIRLFWSQDEGFLQQFRAATPWQSVTYQPVSVYPTCANDMSMWLPAQADAAAAEDEVDGALEADFMDLVRELGGDMVERVTVIDRFTHPKSGRRSLCFRIVYRHMERTLTQEEVNRVHGDIEAQAIQRLRVEIR